MAQPTTSPRQNTIRRPVERNEPRPRMATAKPASRGQRPSLNWGAALDRWMTDQRSTLTLGVLLMGMALGLLVAFLSYLLNGPADQSVVGAAFSEPLAEAANETRNWVGLVGAYIAHVFVFRWFGVGALAIPLIVFLAGYKLTFRTELMPLRRTTIGLLFGAVWCSLLLGYIVLVTHSAQTASVWCGGVGYELNVALYGLFGWGNLAFIAFLLFFFVVYFFDVRNIKLPDLSRPVRQRNAHRGNALQTYEESEAELEEEDDLDQTEVLDEPVLQQSSELITAYDSPSVLSRDADRKSVV